MILSADGARHRIITGHQEIQAQASIGAERDLGFFFRESWRILEPSTPLLRNWHQDYIAEHLEAVTLGQITRLIINIPPRYAKSNLVTVAFPAWTWARNPGSRFMCFSYALPLATKHSVDRRMLIESPWYQRAWGHRFELSRDQNQKTIFTNDKRGAMLSGSVRGGALGQGADIIIVDDPHNVKSVDSDLMREADCQTFDRGVRSRLNAKTGAIIIVMQRLHERDLTGHVLHEEPGVWTHLKIPATEPARKAYVFPISGETKVREAGDVLHPERHSAEDLAAMKPGMGSYAFAGQYGQDPAPAGGTIFNRTWWRRWRKLPDRFDRRLVSLDAAFKGEDDSDFVCLQLWGKKGPDFYLIDQVHARMDFVSTLQSVRDFLAKHPGVFEVVVEDKANGPAVISSLKRKFPGVVEFEPQGSKVSRARAVSPLMESKNVWLPESAPWVGDYIEEFSAFPKAANDDRVDATTMALLRFQGNASGEFTKDNVPASTTIAPSRNTGDQW